MYPLSYAGSSACLGALEKLEGLDREVDVLLFSRFSSQIPALYIHLGRRNRTSLQVSSMLYSQTLVGGGLPFSTNYEITIQRHGVGLINRWGPKANRSILSSL